MTSKRGIVYSDTTIANLPRTGEHFLAAVEAKLGRVVVIGDFVIFGDEYLEKADNKKLVLNIFRWLIRKNSLECFNAQFETKIKYGKTSTFSISLSNPDPKRLEHISCLLESDATISEPEQRIRSLPGRGRAQLQKKFIFSEYKRRSITYPLLHSFLQMATNLICGRLLNIICGLISTKSQMQ